MCISWLRKTVPLCVQLVKLTKPTNLCQTPVGAPYPIRGRNTSSEPVATHGCTRDTVRGGAGFILILYETPRIVEP